MVTPWNIYNSPVAINYFLGGLGALLGPLFGIIVVDYYLVKRRTHRRRRPIPGRDRDALLVHGRREPRSRWRLRDRGGRGRRRGACSGLRDDRAVLLVCWGRYRRGAVLGVGAVRESGYPGSRGRGVNDRASGPKGRRLMMERKMIPAGYSDRLYNEDLAPAKERRWGTLQHLRAVDERRAQPGELHVRGGVVRDRAVGVAGAGFVAARVHGHLRRDELDGLRGPAHGVPFPVFSRISFGVWGANLPALIRAVIAIAWYGIQTYLASVAINVLLARALAWVSTPLTEVSFLGLSALGLDLVRRLWFVQLVILTRGHRDGAKVPGLGRADHLGRDARDGGVAVRAGRRDLL